MSKKEFVVFGLGRFGRSVAVTLAESGCEVLVVDEQQENIQEMADVVTYAVKADVTDSVGKLSLQPMPYGQNLVLLFDEKSPYLPFALQHLVQSEAKHLL